METMIIQPSIDVNTEEVPNTIIYIPVPIGELWDKYTILLIKLNKIIDDKKRNYIQNEMTYLDTRMNTFSYQQNTHFLNLKKVNEKLWDIEDALRIKESYKMFDQEFIELARQVYYKNDERAQIKKQINIDFHSDIHEVKSYANYN
jgi:hypothetical protein